MKKGTSLALQITIIFSLAFLITSLFLGVLITRRLDGIYEDTIYDRLVAEARAVRLAQSREFESAENISYIAYSESENIYVTSDNLLSYIDETTINLLLGKAIAQDIFQSRNENSVNGETIYYVISNYQGVLDVNQNIIITIADATMKNALIKNTRRQIYFVCLLAFALGYIIVLIWISKFVDDTRKITSALKKIGDDHYRTRVHTKRKDEIGELTDSIEEMRKKIISNEKTRQEVIQGVSHDLKTPIALISSYAEAYKDGLCDAGELADVVGNQTKRLNAKVTKLLNLTRLGYIDKTMKTASKTDMNSLVKEVADMYTYQSKVTFSIDMQHAEFSGDRESWLIAVQNLTDNAIRYANSKVTIELQSDWLSIFNDGPQIDENAVSEIFDAYSKGSGGNFGIGLSIVKRTVEIFGYKIKAENKDDGVRFTIYK